MASSGGWRIYELTRDENREQWCIRRDLGCKEGSNERRGEAVSWFRNRLGSLKGKFVAIWIDREFPDDVINKVSYGWDKCIESEETGLM